MSGDEGRFLLRVFWWTLVLRYALAVFLNVFADNSAVASMFWGDSNTYDAGGYALALVWQGDAWLERRASPEIVGRFGFYYFVGAIYFVFGRNQLLVQFLNGSIGALTVVVMHALATRLFGPLVARRVAILMAFFPGMVFWSAGMYKDPAILLCIAVSMYAVVRLREAVSPAMLLLFVGSVLALVTLRFYIAYFVVFATLASFVFTRRGSLFSRILSYALLVGALAAVFTLAVRPEGLEEQSTLMTLERLQMTRDDQAHAGAVRVRPRATTFRRPEGRYSRFPVGLTYLALRTLPVGHRRNAAGAGAPRDAGLVRADAGLRRGTASCDPTPAWRRPAHPHVRGDSSPSPMPSCRATSGRRTASGRR